MKIKSNPFILGGYTPSPAVEPERICISNEFPGDTAATLMPLGWRPHSESHRPVHWGSSEPASGLLPSAKDKKNRGVHCLEPSHEIKIAGRICMFCFKLKA